MEYKKLSEVCDVRDGTHDSPKYVTEGYPLVTSKNIVDGKLDLSVINYLSQEDYDKINERSKVDVGDIIMPMIGTIGNPYIVEEFTDFAIKNVALVKFPNDSINNRFVWYFLKSELFNRYVAEKNKGGTQKFLSLGDIRSLNIPIINKNEQDEIVELLDKVSSIIEIRKYELIKLDDLIKARFVEMFGKEEHRKKLIKLCKFINGDRGKNYPSGTDIVDSGVPFINAGHLEGNKIDFSNMNYITEEKYQMLNSGKIQLDDILYCLRGSLGKKAIVEFEMGAIASSLVILRSFGDIEPIFLLYSLEQPYILEQMNKANNGSSQPNLSAQSVKDYEVILPSREKQLEFADFVKQVDKSKVVVQKALDEAQILFDSLMQEYFG